MTHSSILLQAHLEQALRGPWQHSGQIVETPADSSRNICAQRLALLAGSHISLANLLAQTLQPALPGLLVLQLSSCGFCLTLRQLLSTQLKALLLLRSQGRCLAFRRSCCKRSLLLFSQLLVLQDG